IVFVAAKVLDVNEPPTSFPEIGAQVTLGFAGQRQWLSNQFEPVVHFLNMQVLTPQMRRQEGQIAAIIRQLIGRPFRFAEEILNGITGRKGRSSGSRHSATCSN